MNAALRTMLVALLALSTQNVQAQQAFPTPDEAAKAFVAALGTERADAERLAALLGQDWRSYIPQQGGEREDVEAFLALYRERHEIRPEARHRSRLVVGNSGWELPLPLVLGRHGWFFDTRAGGETIRLRRIGRNELATLQAVRAYHDDEGHTWPQTAEHFNMSQGAVRQRCYRARKERAAEAEEKAKEEAHKNEVPLFD